MHVAFDLDGCLIDSAELIKRSYRDAGVEPPEDMLAQEGVQWIEDLGYSDDEVLEIRKRKNAAFLERLRTDHVRTTSAWWVSKRLHDAGHFVAWLSGSPPGTFKTIADIAGPEPLPCTIALDAHRTPAKMRWVRGHRKPLVYVDDQSKFVDLPTSARFVHYDLTMTEFQLLKEIQEAHEQTLRGGGE